MLFRSVTTEINSATPGQYGRLNVTGAATLDGTLNIDKTAGYVPAVNDTILPVTYVSRTGSFAFIVPSFATTFTPTYNLTNLSLVVSGLNATNTWNDLSGDHNWLTSGNWSLSHVPTSGEDVSLPLGTIVNIPSGTQVVRSVTSTEPLNIAGGATLDFSAASTFGANLTLAGTLQGGGAATFTSGTLNWSGGTLKGNGLFTASGGILTLGNSFLDGRTFNNSVNATLSGGNLTLANGAVFNHNAGTFSISDNSGIIGSGQFNNAATFSKTGGGGTSSIAGVQFVNPGTVNANSGVLDIAVNGTHSGVFSVTGGGTLRFSAGATLTAASTVTGAGTLDVSGGATNVAGTYNPSTTNVSGGTLNFNATTTLGTLNLAAGSVGGTGDLTVSTDFNKTGGSFVNTGNLDLTAAGDFTVGVFNNPGKTVALRAPAGAILDGSAGNNVTANTLTLSARNGIALDTTVANVSVTNTTSGNVALANAGALNVNGITQSGGNLSVAAGGAITQSAAAIVSGTASFSAGANPITLNHAANDFTGAVTLTNAGANDVAIRDVNALQFAGATVGRNLTVTANGAISQTGPLTVPGATTLQAGAGNDIALGLANDFGSVGITATRNATIVEANNVTLNASTVTTALVVSAPGTLSVGGALNGNSVALTSTGGNLNGAGIITAGTITLNAVTGIGTAPANPVNVRPASSAGLTATNTGANDIVLYQPAGNLLVGSGGATLSNTGGGYVVGAGGNLTINSGAPASGNMILAGNSITVAGSGYSNAGDIALSAVNNVNINGTLSAGNNLAITAGNNVSLTDAVASSGGFLSVSAGTLDVTATATFTQMRAGTNFTATIGGATTLQGGAGVAAEIKNSGPGTFRLNTGSLALNGGSGAGYARLLGNPDVDLKVSSGLINLNGVAGGAYAAVEGVSPATIRVNFPNLTADGYFVNGVVNTVYDAPTTSGFVAGGAPAILVGINPNLFVTYSGVLLVPPVPPPVPPIVQQQVSQVAGQISQLNVSPPLPPPPPPPTEEVTIDANGNVIGASGQPSAAATDDKSGQKTAGTSNDKGAKTATRKVSACR